MQACYTGGVDIAEESKQTCFYIFKDVKTGEYYFHEEAGQ